MSRAAPRSWSQPPGLILQSFSNQVLSSINILSRLSPGLASYSIKGSGEHSYSLLSPSFLAFEEPTSNEQRPLVALIAGTAVRLERLYILHVYQNGSLTLHWLGKLVQATLSGGQTSAVGHVLGPRNLTLLPTISISLLPWDMDYGNRVHGRMASLDSDHDMTMLSRRPSAPMPRGHRLSRRKESIQHSHPRPPLTPNTTSMPQSMANPLLASAPASPPTPAPSPTPHQRSPTSWHLAIDDIQDPTLEEARNIFCGMDTAAKENWLRSLVEACDNHSLSFLHRIVSPRLKKDPFKALPNELCFRVCTNTINYEGDTAADATRYSNLSTIPKPSSAPHKFQGDGVRSLVMIKPGRLFARNTHTGECPAIQLGQALTTRALLRAKFFTVSIFVQPHQVVFLKTCLRLMKIPRALLLFDIRHLV